jgi:hypothetical protein
MLKSLIGIYFAEDYFIHDLAQSANFDAENSIKSKVNLCIKPMLGLLFDLPFLLPGIGE